MHEYLRRQFLSIKRGIHFQLLTERHEKLTVGEIARALHTEQANVRSAMKRLHARRAIAMQPEIRTYHVGNSTCKHKAALWYVP